MNITMTFPLLPYMIAGEATKYVARRYGKKIILGALTASTMAYGRKRSATSAGLRAAQASTRAQKARRMTTSMASKRKARTYTRRVRSRPARSAGNSVGPETSLAAIGQASLSAFNARLLKQVPPSYFYFNQANQSVGTPGIQTVAGLGRNFLNADLTKTFSIGSQAVGAATGGGTSRSFPLFHKNTFRLKNQENEDAYCVIYDCVPIRDTNSPPETAWATGYTTALGSTTMSSSFINAKPFQSELFKSLWRITKTTRFMLSPGAQHFHTTVARGNKVLSAEILNSNITYLKGWSLASILVVYGGPSDSGPTSAATTISTGSTKIIWVEDVVISFKVLEQNSANFNQLNTLPTSIATEQTMLEAIGQLNGVAAA